MNQPDELFLIERLIWCRSESLHSLCLKLSRLAALEQLDLKQVHCQFHQGLAHISGSEVVNKQHSPSCEPWGCISHTVLSHYTEETMPTVKPPVLCDSPGSVLNMSTESQNGVEEKILVPYHLSAKETAFYTDGTEDPLEALLNSTINVHLIRAFATFNYTAFSGQVFLMSSSWSLLFAHSPCQCSSTCSLS